MLFYYLVFQMHSFFVCTERKFIKLFNFLILLYSEVIGYVDGIEASRIVGRSPRYKFFKFYLNNGAGRRIQIVAWNEDIDRIEHFIRSNFCNFS